MAQSKIDVSNLDFDTIRQELKTYLKGQSEFKDYDFDGSGMSVLIDILAQNTYMNAFYNNMVVNESFLDTAVRRENLVSKGKMVGYVPRSCRSARALLQVSIVPTDSPSSITLFKGAKFTTKIDGSTYTFLTTEDTLVYKDTDGDFITEVEVSEGYNVSYSYIHNASGNRTYAVLDRNIDTTSLEVNVRPDINSTEIVPYYLKKDITTIGPDSKIFYLEEGTDGRYYISFGDDVLGHNPANGAKISITGRVCSSDLPNGANIFLGQGYVAHNTANSTIRYAASTVVTVESANSGQPRETVESIRFNAPRYNVRQNRNVIPNDYASFLLERYSDLQAVSVWGGENHVPAIYGKCFISAKPVGGYNLTTIRKLEIIEQLKEGNVMTIEPVIIDASFTFIKPTIKVRYNPQLTSLGPDGVGTKVAQTVVAFEGDNLGTFSKSFRASKFIAALDETDASIVSSSVSHIIEKRFNPRLNENVSYTILTNAQVNHPYDGFLGAISSSKFYCTLTDVSVQLEDDGFGKLNLVSYDSGSAVLIKKNIGTIDYSSGVLKFNGIIITDTVDDSISVYFAPRDSDYTPIRNMIVLISTPRIEMIDYTKNEVVYVTTAATEGSFNVATQDVSNILI